MFCDSSRISSWFLVVKFTNPDSFKVSNFVTIVCSDNCDSTCCVLIGRGLQVHKFMFCVCSLWKFLVLSNLLEVSSFQVESAVNQAQQVGSNIFDAASRVIGPVIEFVKPGIDVALPLVKQAGEEVLKNASPVISDASKKAQEAMQSAGMDTQPVMTAAKVWL